MYNSYFSAILVTALPLSNSNFAINYNLWQYKLVNISEIKKDLLFGGSFWLVFLWLFLGGGRERQQSSK